MKQSLRARMGVLCGAAVMMSSSMAVGQPYSYETLEVLAPDGQAQDWFGYSMAIGGGYMAVCSYNPNDLLDPGRVRVFSAGDGEFLYELTAPGISDGDAFGFRIAIDGSLLVVSAPNDQDATGIRTAGVVYIFNLSDGAYIARLTANDAAITDQLGWGLGISTPAIVAGAPNDIVGSIRMGSVYVFDSRFHSQIRKFTPPGGTENARYGAALSVNQTYLAVCALRLDSGLGETGAVFVYSYFDGSLVNKLEANDPQVGQGFGSTVGILGDRIYVGAPYDDDRGGTAGAVYVFDAVSGDQLAKILPPAVNPVPNNGMQFGTRLVVDEHMLLVAARLDDELVDDNGAVYVYDPVTYDYLDKILLPDAMVDDAIGNSLAAGDRQYGVSATNRDTQGTNSGSAFIITQNCRPDVNDDSLVDFFDVSSLVNARIDYNGDGVFNFFDVSAFLSDFQIGCP